MRLEIRASDVKDWFQYRCDRKLIYSSLPQAERDDVPVETIHKARSIRADEGIEFEADIVATLRRRGESVLGPRSHGDHYVAEALTKAFLLRERTEEYLHQGLLKETPALRRDLDLASNTTLRNALPDILRWVVEDDEYRLRVVDIKHTRRPTQYHRAQVAFYALLLRGMYAAFGMDAPLSPKGNIWHISDGGGWEEERGLFDLNPYEEMLRDFFRRQFPNISIQRLGRGIDETAFHLYFKCEQCDWLHHCGKSIAADLPVSEWDISAIPGMSHQSKAALVRAGVKTVGSAAAAETLPPESWSLRTRGKLLISRAGALVEGDWSRLPEHHTWLMPPKVDVPIFLVVDSDPVSGHLATLGCLVGGVRLEEPRIEVIANPGQELPAIKRVLGRLIDVLHDLDAHNREASEETALTSHIFVYEPAEAADLQTAMSRHLDDPGIRTGLLNLVRLFPPEEIRAPEPEYRGAHHLPASALRSVMEQLYVLPAKVSYDLARVSRSLRTANPPPKAPYLPRRPFARPFSARLSIDIMRDRSMANDGAIRADVAARLSAMAGLCEWVLEDNRKVIAGGGKGLLRLKKSPFRFQSAFHPLEATDLETLLAQELLQSRAERLAALVELARPVHERRERLRCFAGLVLKDLKKQGAYYVMNFEVPKESRDAELRPGSLGLILTDDDPDLRLDPRSWPHCSANLVHVSAQGAYITLRMYKKTWTSAVMAAVRERLKHGGDWCLDQAHVDVTTQRMESLLRFLSEVDHGA
ncbi:MAG: hypothetical protein VX899_08000 [Myxococcota bacterium]|nr:hypothetical protein [Myxococcota bacterium]